jgi:hypothetical protein
MEWHAIFRPRPHTELARVNSVLAVVLTVVQECLSDVRALSFDDTSESLMQIITEESS